MIQNLALSEIAHLIRDSSFVTQVKVGTSSVTPSRDDPGLLGTELALAPISGTVEGNAIRYFSAPTAVAAGAAKEIVLLDAEGEAERSDADSDPERRLWYNVSVRVHDFRSGVGRELMALYVRNDKRLIVDPGGKPLSATGDGGPVEPPPPGGPFEGHNGPMTTITDTTVTPNVVHTVPAFMKGFERDTDWSVGSAPTQGIRFRDPKSKRQFRPGQFNDFSTYNGFMGCRPLFHGSNLIGYGQNKKNGPPSDYDKNATTTWERIAGGSKTPTNTNPLTYSEQNTGTKFFPNNLKGHPNLGAFRNDPSPATMAVGVYMTTLPFGNS